MDGQGLRMCRFTRDGIPELGEYLESVDGTGICKLTELDGGGEEVVVCLPDGTMPEGISDLELVRVPTRIEEGDAKTETMSDETAERMARTRFIVDEYTMGVLINSLKGASSRILRRRYEIRTHRNHLWSPSYYAASSGGAPLETLKQYIRNQQTPE